MPRRREIDGLQPPTGLGVSRPAKLNLSELLNSNQKLVRRQPPPVEGICKPRFKNVERLSVSEKRRLWQRLFNPQRRQQRQEWQQWEFGETNHRSSIHRSIPWHYLKPVVAGSLTIAIIFLGLFVYHSRTLQTALAQAGAGVDSLLAGTQTIFTQPAQAKAEFMVSTNSFESSAEALRDLDALSKSLFIFPYARESLQLLRLGHHAALAGEALSRTLADQPTPNAATTNIADISSNSFTSTVSQKTNWIVDWQAKHQADFAEALTHLKAMSQIFDKLDPNKLPANLREKIITWKERLPRLEQQARALVTLTGQTPDLFGENGARRYVILFQNNTELRPTGGFIGSYATLELTNRDVSNFWVQTNVWKSDTAFSAQHPITPPYPISEATTVWAMRDANWNPDFRETAKQVLDFYQKMYGQPAHGVIAIDTSIILKLLQLTGPIDFPEYQTTLDANNFLEIVQYKVEIEYFNNKGNKVENEPKQIIADFIPKFIGRLNNLEDDQRAHVNQILVEALARKSIQLYSSNQAAQKTLTQLNLDGRLQETDSDYLYINNANIGGGKSSLNVTEEVVLKQTGLGNPIENTLQITRSHHGNGTWPDADNVNYMRIYVPKGSELIKTDGAFELHEVSEENDKTVFAGWFNTKVATKRYAEIQYRLPARITKNNYSLLLQRQPGANPTTFSFENALISAKSLILNEDTVLEDN